MADTQIFLMTAGIEYSTPIEYATPISYPIYITDIGLPTLGSPWTKVELGAGVYSFRRTPDVSKTFDMSGYIQSTTMEATRLLAESLNDNLLYNPSGVLVDGFGNQYTVYVNSWQIKPVAAINKYTITMSYTIVG